MLCILNLLLTTTVLEDYLTNVDLMLILQEICFRFFRFVARKVFFSQKLKL